MEAVAPITEPARFFHAQRLERRAASTEHTLDWQFSKHVPDWSALPVVVLARLLYFLEEEPEDLASFGATCKAWRRVWGEAHAGRGA